MLREETYQVCWWPHASMMMNIKQKQIPIKPKSTASIPGPAIA